MSNQSKRLFSGWLMTNPYEVSPALPSPANAQAPSKELLRPTIIAPTPLSSNTYPPFHKRNHQRSWYWNMERLWDFEFELTRIFQTYSTPPRHESRNFSGLSPAPYKRNIVNLEPFRKWNSEIPGFGGFEEHWRFPSLGHERRHCKFECKHENRLKMLSKFIWASNIT